MSQVYTSIIRPVIANTFLLGSFDLSVFQNLHCDEKSFMIQSNVSTLYLFIFCFYLFIYLIFVYLIDFIQTIRQVLEFSRTHFALFLARSIMFSVVDADWLNALRRFPIR